MSALNKDGISNSIVTQLVLKNPITIIAVKSIVSNSDLDSYNSIKLLSKEIKDYLKSNKIEIQHSKVLNVISKSLGHQNHHALKIYFNSLQKYKIEIDIVNDSTLKKLFLLRKEFISKFDIEKASFGYFTHKSVEFDFFYEKIGMGLRSKEKLEINRYLKSKGFKPYKNTLSLCKIKYDDIRRVAFNILQNYQSFFKPIWFEQDDTLDNPKGAGEDWWLFSYSDIEYKSQSYLLVDSYSTDLAWNIIINFLNYAFTFGTLDDIEYFEKCLKQKNYMEHKREVKILKEVSQINRWEKRQVLASMVKNKTKSIKTTLNKIQYPLRIQKYMNKYLKNIEVANNKSIKNILVENSDYFYNKGQYIEQNIKEKLSIDLLKTKLDTFMETMEEIDDLAMYREYHDTYNCIEYLSKKIILLIKMYIDMQKNYSKYIIEFKKEGYIR